MTCAAVITSGANTPVDVTSHTLSLFPRAAAGPAPAPLPLWQPVSGSLAKASSADVTAVGIHAFSSPITASPVDIHLTIVAGHASLAVSRCILTREKGSNSEFEVPTDCVTTPNAENSEVYSAGSLPILTANLPYVFAAIFGHILVELAAITGVA